jgi:hypothetical protein
MIENTSTDELLTNIFTGKTKKKIKLKRLDFWQNMSTEKHEVQGPLNIKCLSK